MASDNTTFYELAETLDGIMKDADRYRSLYCMERQQAEEDIKRYASLKDRAILGDKNARSYIIDQYTLLLSSKYIQITDAAIEKVINFNDVLENRAQVLFEMLLDMYDMSVLIERNKLNIKFTEIQLKNIVKSELDAISQHYKMLTSRLRLLATLIYAKEYGQDCIDTLQHHNINEIGIIDKDYIYISCKGSKLFLQFLHFENRNIILNIQKKTTQNSVVNYDENNPAVVTSKLNSSRICVIGYSMTPDDEQLYYNERIFNLKKITLEELRDIYHTIDDAVYRFLVLNQKGRGSYYITGADMGIGKSTFLQAMIEKIPDSWGIGVLDSQNELQLRNKYPDKNIKTLIETPSRSIEQCFEIMLKMARDIVIVGEITKPSEVAGQINASLRLNAGVGGTMHTFSPFEVITNVRNLLMRTDMYTNTDMAEADAARAIDLVIHLVKLPGGRIVVERVVEIVPFQIEGITEPVLQGSNSKRLAGFLNMAQLALYRYLCGKSFYYNEIFRYQAQKDNWLAVNAPSNRYLNKILKYTTEDEIQNVMGLFKNVKDGMLSWMH